MGEDFVELPPYGSLAGCVAFAFYVRRVLEKRQHTRFAVLGECVQVEQPVICRSGIHFEVAGVDDHAEGCVNGQRNAIHQTVRDLNGMDCEWSNLETLPSPYLT